MPETVKRPRSKTGSFRKTVVHVGDHEKQFLRVIVCCAFRKLSGAFGSILPGPVKRRPPSGLHKETIFMGFPGCFQRSHRSLQDQLKSLPAEDAHSGVLLSLRLDRKYRAIEGRTPAKTKKPMPFKIRAEVEPRGMGDLGVFCNTARSFRSCRGLASAAFEDHHFHRLDLGRCSVRNKAGTPSKDMLRGIAPGDAKAPLGLRRACAA